MRTSNGVRFIVAIAALLSVQACTVVVRHPVHPAPPGHVVYDDDFRFEYYYYPSAQVYFHLYSGYYYYRSGTRWVRARVLPPRFRLYAKDRYKFKYRDGRPYTRHDYYRKQFKPRLDVQQNGRHDRLERELLKKRYNEYRYRRSDRLEDSRQYRREKYQDRKKFRSDGLEAQRESHRSRDSREDAREDSGRKRREDSEDKDNGRKHRDDDDRGRWRSR